MNKKNTSVMSVQYINRKLKEISREYKICNDPSKFKCHSLRKSMGKKIFESTDNSERSLVLLSQVFNHNSLSSTKRYIGITDKEISNIYDWL